MTEDAEGRRVVTNDELKALVARMRNVHDTTAHEGAKAIEALMAERIKRERLIQYHVDLVSEWIGRKKVAQSRAERAEAALHRISLGAQDSGTTKEALGREARAVLAQIEKETMND